MLVPAKSSVRGRGLDRYSRPFFDTDVKWWWSMKIKYVKIIFEKLKLKIIRLNPSAANLGRVFL
jgi:hypothetical protein